MQIHSFYYYTIYLITLSRSLCYTLRVQREIEIKGVELGENEKFSKEAAFGE